MRKNEEDRNGALLLYGKWILIGGAVGFAACLLFLALAAIGIAKGAVGSELRYQLTAVGCVLGGMTGGLTAVRNCKDGGAATGLATGGVMFLFQLTLALLLYRGFSMENGGVGLLCSTLCGGTAAGILGGGRKKSGKHKKRKRG